MIDEDSFMTTNQTLRADEVGWTRSSSFPWEGRLFGALVLSAFVLYGVGSAFADEASHGLFFGGLPRERSVDSSPRCLAVRSIHEPLP